MPDLNKKKTRRKKAEDSKKVESFIEDALKKLEIAVEADRHNRQEAAECLNFSLGGAAQWDDLEAQRRKRRKRLMLSVNQCPKYIKQLTGELRQTRVTIKVNPSDSVATSELALVRQGLINNILYQSDFDTIQDNGAKQLITCGYGGWRVRTRWDEANPFQQEIFIEEVENPLMVYFDPKSKDFLYRDASYCFVLTKMSQADFEEEFPNSETASESFKKSNAPGGTWELWYEKNTAITVAELFKIVPEEVELALLSTGEVMEKSEAEKAIKDWKDKWERPSVAEGTPSIAPIMPGPMLSPPSATGLSPIPPLPIQAPPKPEIVETKTWNRPKVRYWKMTGVEILEGGIEGKEIPGRFIPVVLVRGEKINVEGKTYIKGLITDLREPQKLLNYWETSAAENVALAPKTPWIATAKQLKGYEKFYAAANDENYPFIVYNVDPETPQTKPTRESGPNPPQAIFLQIDRAERNIKNAAGMFGADTGDMDMMSGRASAAAITQRQQPSSDSTFLFKDNLEKAVAFTGQIIDSMLPIIYDTERDVRLRSVDGSGSLMPINTTIRAALEKVRREPNRYSDLSVAGLQSELVKRGAEAKFNALGVGKYETVIKTGPDYATQKADSARMMIQLTQANPKAMSVLLDLIVKNMSFIDSDEARERLEKLLPPGMVKPKPGKPPAPPMPPAPQAQVAMIKAEAEKMKVEVQRQRLQVEKIKALKELQGEKGEMRKMLIELLKEVYSEEGA